MCIDVEVIVSMVINQNNDAIFTTGKWRTLKATNAKYKGEKIYEELQVSIYTINPSSLNVELGFFDCYPAPPPYK